jgi:hypothetical protein
MRAEYDMTAVRHTRRREIEPLLLPAAGVLMLVYLAFMQPPARSLFASAD